MSQTVLCKSFQMQILKKVFYSWEVGVSYYPFPSYFLKITDKVMNFIAKGKLEFISKIQRRATILWVCNGFNKFTISFIHRTLTLHKIMLEDFLIMFDIDSKMYYYKTFLAQKTKQIFCNFFHSSVLYSWLTNCWFSILFWVMFYISNT